MTHGRRIGKFVLVGWLIAATGLLAGCETPEQLAARKAAQQRAADEEARKQEEAARQAAAKREAEKREQQAQEKRKREEAARQEAEQKAKLAKVTDAEQAGVAAEANRKPREAFKQYLAGLEALADLQAPEVDTRIREKIVKLVPRLTPPPTIPEEAERQMVYGGTALKEAKTAKDYQHAVTEFEKAIRLAPWWGAAYFNLGVVQEKVRDYEAAIRNLNLYLLASPDAPDAKEVKAKVYELEFKLKKPLAERLTGLWGYTDQPGASFQVEGAGDSVKVYMIKDGRKDKLYFEGRAEGMKIAATYDVYQLLGCYDAMRTCYLPKTLPVLAEISKDMNSMVINIQEPDVDVSIGILTNDFTYTEKSQVRQWRNFTVTRKE